MQPSGAVEPSLLLSAAVLVLLLVIVLVIVLVIDVSIPVQPFRRSEAVEQSIISCRQCYPPFDYEYDDEHRCAEHEQELFCNRENARGITIILQIKQAG